MTDDVIESEFLTIDSEGSIDDVSFNADSLDDEDVAENVDIVIIAFDVERDVVTASSLVDFVDFF